MNYLIYARVSPKGSGWDREETSIPDQVSQCKAYILTLDPDAKFKVIQDEFATGKNTKRPGYRQILKELNDGSASWDTLVVRHYDRIARSLVDSMDLIKLMQQKGKGLISTSQRIDLSTPAGRAMLIILLVFAEWEREMISERTKMRMESIARQGLWPVGLPPFGYARRGKGDNKIYPYPRNAEKVKSIFQKYLDGVGTMDLAREYGVSKNEILYMLRNKTYLGLLCYDGKEFKGQHEPLIDQNTFNRVQDRIPKKKVNPRPGAQKYPYLLTGLVRCHCGGYLTPSTSHGRSEKYHYYRCTDQKECKFRVRADALEKLIIDAVSGIQVDAEDTTDMAARIKQQFNDHNDRQLPEMEQIEAAIIEARSEFNRIKQLFLDGVVNKLNASIFNAELEKVNRELQELIGKRDAIKTINDPGLQVLFDASEWAKMLNNFGDVFRHSGNDSSVLASTIRSLIEKIEHDSGEKWTVTFHCASGSPNRQEWLAMITLGEPLFIRASDKVWIRVA